MRCFVHCVPLVLAAAGSAQIGAELMVPLHSAADDPVAGAYGIWAGGHHYKASFHDGFRIFPLLGERAPRNLPLAWRTETIRLGDRAVFAGGAQDGARDGDWRYVYRHPDVVAAYGGR